MKRNRNVLIAVVAISAIVLAGGYWWMNSGYGEVSPKTYEFATALYGACQTQSEERLNRVEELLGSTEGQALPSNEHRWLKAIIERARKGNWPSAAKQARRMMEDQVQY